MPSSYPSTSPEPLPTTHLPVLSSPHELALTYMTHDEFVDAQNRQDHFLSHELNAIRDGQEQTNKRLEKLDTELKLTNKKLDEGFARTDKKFEEIDKKFEEIDKKFEEIDKRFDRVEQKLDDSIAKQEQFDAVFRNSLLSNPTLPLQPVIAIDPLAGKRMPKVFPRNANEFYSLREPTQQSQKNVLVYLVEFYDVVPATSEFIVENPYDAVDRLEQVLGLEEDRFIRFRERAKEYATRSNMKPIKRSNELYFDLARNVYPKVDSSSEAKTNSSDGARVYWDPGPRLPRVTGGTESAGPAQPADAPDMKSTDWAGTTNPNTSIRTSSDQGSMA